MRPAKEPEDGQIRYARSGDARIAYRTLGSGDTTLVFHLGWAVGSVDTFDRPTSPYASALNSWTPHMRVLMWDRRGTGLSDPVAHILSLDERVADLRAVLDAAGVDRAVLWGAGESGPVSIRFAAMHPQRVSALVLPLTAARFSQDPPDFPWGFSTAEVDAHLEDIDLHWGVGALADIFFGAAAALPGVRDDFGRRQRAVSSPTLAKLLWKATMEFDVRDQLSSICAPTLVLARPGDRFAPFEASAALAAGIEGAQLRALPPGDHSCFDIIDLLATETLEFVCGTSIAAPTARVLATTLFTDIVSSTELLSACGDAHWCSRLGTHDDIVENLLARHGGHRAKHTGDGVFALFDSPSNAAQCGLELAGALAIRGLRIRAAVHTGECERRGEEWSGVAIHLGARMVAVAAPGEVVASRTVRDLCAGSRLTFDERGTCRLKGFSEAVPIYRVRQNRYQ